MLPTLNRIHTLAAVRVAGVGLVGIGTAAQVGWMAEFFLDTGLSPLHAAPNDLSARGQPYGELFRTLELTAGIAFLLACPPLARLAPVQWRARTTIVAVGAFGALLILRAAFPLDCASSIESMCRQSAHSVSHNLNFVISVLLSVVYVLGPVTLLLWWEGRWRIVPSIIVAVESAAWVALVALSVAASGQFVGLVMRMQLLGGAAVLVCGGTYLLTTGRHVRTRWEDSRG